MEQRIGRSMDGPGDELQVFLRALTSNTRQRLLRHFTDGNELTVSEVAERSGLRPSTTSEHLAVLRRGRLLQSTQDGKLVRYRADKEGIALLLGELQTYLLTPPHHPQQDASRSESP
ncbi:ArsR/SmtB family transcription factor [Streptomyces cucumeris]|uniref:ArsR/SmtB family transcription factor n=1 Tax=Streptomyces cucumeris TaxID=2962890 RepID=UPI003D705143